MEYDQQAAQSQQQKKKRAYAQQAYEFGQNAPQQLGQAPPPMMGAMGSMGAQQTPMGAQQVPASPQEQLSNQFGQMNLQQQPQQGYMQPQMQQPIQQPIQQPVQQQMPAMGLANQNQLLPSDLMSQPFLVQELDNAPPPINLPPNVGWSIFCAPLYTDER
jgi:protein transport protein SEC24